MKKYLILMPLIGALISCGEFESDIQFETNKICKEHGIERRCTTKEVEVIDGVQNIIDRIVAFDPASLNEDFLLDEVKGNAYSHLYLLGENHTDFEGQLKTWGYINHLGKNGGTVLLEGLSRKVEVKNDILIYILARLYALREIGPANIPQSISLKDLDELIKKHLPIKEIILSLKNYNFSDFKLLNLEYGFWDKSWKKRKRGQITFDMLVKRNISMVKAIFNAWAKIGDMPLFIVAGALHLPLGERYEFQALNRHISIPDGYDAYYRFIDKLRKRRPETDFGPTKVIYASLKNAGIGFFQAIPKRSMLH